jgi:hypothetical protein
LRRRAIDSVPFLSLVVTGKAPRAFYALPRSLELPQQDVIPLRLQFGSRARSHLVAVDELLSYLLR